MARRAFLGALAAPLLAGCRPLGRFSRRERIPAAAEALKGKSLQSLMDAVQRMPGEDLIPSCSKSKTLSSEFVRAARPVLKGLGLEQSGRNLVMLRRFAAFSCWKKLLPSYAKRVESFRVQVAKIETPSQMQEAMRVFDRIIGIIEKQKPLLEEITSSFESDLEIDERAAAEFEGTIREFEGLRAKLIRLMNPTAPILSWHSG
jgi:hypothetical protein